MCEIIFPSKLTTPCLHHFFFFSTGQVLANMAAMGSEKFCADRLPGGKVVGNFDFSKVNTRGGSLSLGHPFGATGECSKCVNSEFISCVVCCHISSHFSKPRLGYYKF